MIDPDNPKLLALRKRLPREFIKNDWSLLGSMKIRDEMNAESYVWILRRE